MALDGLESFAFEVLEEQPTASLAHLAERQWMARCREFGVTLYNDMENGPRSRRTPRRVRTRSGCDRRCDS
jgi:hypothetical protein